ncbi:Uracil phosphoribosyltransferase domain containing protein [Rhypophila sp. PSN 637]
MTIAAKKLDDILEKAASVRRNRPIRTLLFIDGDKTLAPVDTGTQFWKVHAQHHSTDSGSEVLECPLKALFSSPMGYSFDAFRQAALLYDEVLCNETYEKFHCYCTQVSSNVTLYSEFIWLLRSVSQNETLVPIVLTCGLADIWMDVLARVFGERAADAIGNEIAKGGIVVTPQVKADLVKYAQEVHGLEVWAFGDSVLDVPMMINADHAVVVVGREHQRSKSMELELGKAIDEHRLQAVQVLLPENEAIKPRLDINRLPIVRFKDLDFDPSLSDRKGEPVLHATARPAAKLLMTPTRDATVAGPALREAHRQVGRYLATEFVSELVGLETYSISHVQKREIEGYRLRSEATTIIVPLMRGGEPMAFGVNDVFPLAMFLHAKEPAELKKHHVEGRNTIILVDSVVNSGKSVIEFVEHIRGPLSSDIAIVVVAGVVQAGSVKGDGLLAQYMEQDYNLTLVALRLSENKYTGRGGTDTGNRLFNATHLD